MYSLKLLSKIECLILVSLVAVLVYVSQFNFLLFHSLIEIAIVTTGFLTFAFAWHLRRFVSGYLMVVGILLGCTAFISVLHLLSYKGMGVFVGNVNIPTQLWIASRYILSLILLSAGVLPVKTYEAKKVSLFLVSITFISTYLVFSGNFPDCYLNETGLTPFKIYSEYLISVMLMFSMKLFWNTRKEYSPDVVTLILLFFTFSIISELLFTSYLGVYDFSNMLGHITHLIASYFVYKAIVVTGLVKSIDLLFKNLNEAVTVRDEFISLASHELKTPLTPLKFHLQMFVRELHKVVPEGASTEKIHRLAERSDQQINRLNQLIDGMLDVSRLSSGKFELSPKEVELSSFISAIAEQLNPEIQAANSTLTLKLSEQVHQIDTLRIEQVLTNLIQNSLKYAPGSAIEVGLVKTNDGKIHIWIQDNGPGIPKEAISKIFNRFERGVQASSASGLGLGLYISRQIVEAHGGSIALNSEIAQGARFDIIL